MRASCTCSRCVQHTVEDENGQEKRDQYVSHRNQLKHHWDDARSSNLKNTITASPAEEEITKHTDVRQANRGIDDFDDVEYKKKQGKESSSISGECALHFLNEKRCDDCLTVLFLQSLLS